MYKMEKDDTGKSKATQVVQSMSGRERTRFRKEGLATVAVIKIYMVTRGKAEQISMDVTELIDLLMDPIKLGLNPRSTIKQLSSLQQNYFNL